MNARSQIDDPKSVTEDLKGVRISEIIVQTSRYEELKQWYQRVLGQDPMFENARPQASGTTPGGESGKAVKASDVRLCFFRLFLDFPYTQTFGIFELHGLNDAPTKDPGLNHMQFRHESLDHLVTRYERLRDAGMRPYRVANHGPGSSFYYKDPDGNVVEMSAANFETESEYLDFFKSDTYKGNPSGIDVDAEEYVGKFRGGMPMKELVKIPA